MPCRPRMLPRRAPHAAADPCSRPRSRSRAPSAARPPTQELHPALAACASDPPTHWEEEDYQELVRLGVLDARGGDDGDWESTARRPTAGGLGRGGGSWSGRCCIRRVHCVEQAGGPAAGQHTRRTRRGCGLPRGPRAMLPLARCPVRAAQSPAPPPPLAAAPAPSPRPAQRRAAAAAAAAARGGGGGGGEGAARRRRRLHPGGVLRRGQSARCFTIMRAVHWGAIHSAAGRRASPAVRSGGGGCLCAQSPPPPPSNPPNQGTTPAAASPIEANVAWTRAMDAKGAALCEKNVAFGNRGRSGRDYLGPTGQGGRTLSITLESARHLQTKGVRARRSRPPCPSHLMLEQGLPTVPIVLAPPPPPLLQLPSLPKTNKPADRKRQPEEVPLPDRVGGHRRPRRPQLDLQPGTQLPQER
jgi:hypothetical protein